MEKQATPDSTKVAVFLDGVLLDVRISFWRGKKPLSPEDLNLRPDDVPEIFTLGRKMIVPKEAIARFESVGAQVNYLIDRWTFPFPTGHAHFIPYSVLPQIMIELNRLKGRFDERMEEFFTNYDGYREQMLAQYPEHRGALEREYDAVPELRRRFHFTWSIFEVSLPKNIRFEAVETSTAIMDATARRQALEEAEASYKAQFDQELDDFLAQSVGMLREKVATVVAGVSERLKNGEVVNTSTLKSVRDSIDQFRALNFMGDKPVEDKLNLLMTMMPDSPQQMSKEGFSKSFQQVLDAVVDAATTTDISEVTGEYKRKVRV